MTTDNASVRKLTLTSHARARAYLRGITADEINGALQGGYREPCGANVLHADLHTHVAVVVDWRQMRIVTVLHLCKSHYQALRQRALGNALT